MRRRKICKRLSAAARMRIGTDAPEIIRLAASPRESAKRAILNSGSTAPIRFNVRSFFSPP